MLSMETDKIIEDTNTNSQVRALGIASFVLSNGAWNFEAVEQSPSCSIGNNRT
jgi:hypothetical protein